jgi:hypothetical protein
VVASYDGEEFIVLFRTLITRKSGPFLSDPAKNSSGA